MGDRPGGSSGHQVSSGEGLCPTGVQDILGGGSQAPPRDSHTLHKQTQSPEALAAL